MIRVLIVEDSITQREIFVRLLADDGELVVVAEARNGREAIEQVQRHNPDVVLMDIHMPDMDGIEATRQIMALCPVPIVVASATLKKRDVDLAMKAYEAGAVSVIEKPEGAVLLHLKKMAPELRRELIAAASARVQRRKDIVETSAAAEKPSSSSGWIPPAKASIAVVGICASTGGPPVLMEILAKLPRPYPLPILLVQHISRGFEEGFAQWLSASTGQPVAIATDGQRLVPGVWIAPGGRHLTLGSTTRLDMPRAEDHEIHCPSGNPLFASLAKHFGAQAAGVQLTGMGDDGAEGLLRLRQAGGTTIIQCEATCLIWGMPRAAQLLDAAQFELSPGNIAEALAGMVK